MASDTAAVRKYNDLVTSQVALNDTTPTKILARTTGQSGDQVTTDVKIMKNMDATDDLYIGGPGVTTANGFPVHAGESVILAGPSGFAIHSDVWAIALSGKTTKVALLTQ